MKRFLTLTFVLALMMLLAMPDTAHAKAAPGLVLKTTEVSLTISPMFPTLQKTPIDFGNRGSVPLRWELYVGSDIAGCVVEAPVKWLSFSPDSGVVGPRTTTQAFLMVDAGYLPSGTTTSILMCMTTNDPFNQSVAIPLSVTIK